ncbi:hypothetical protein [Hoeflea sp. TYP-13]|uniref:hypothetical protein n=1 Tax=Hoeflea sp. TYP-13 TaxID=3230023 RepID=UPI0034C68021
MRDVLAGFGGVSLAVFVAWLVSDGIPIEIGTSVAISFVAMVVVVIAFQNRQRAVAGREIPVPAIIITTVATGIVTLGLVYFFWTERPLSGTDFWRSLSYFVIFYVAIVTFVTTIWRGTIAVRQARTAQHNLLALQSNNLAAQLQRGAELVADEDPAKAEAGVVTLEALAVSADERFSTPAANLLAGFIGQRFRHNHLKETGLFDSARLALAACARNEVYAARELYFECEENEITVAPEDEPGWKLITGVGFVSYSGAEIRGESFRDTGWTLFRFSNVKFIGTDIEANKTDFEEWTFSTCYIAHCKVQITNQHLLYYNRFNRCDFSGCKYRDRIMDIRQLRDGLNPPDVKECYFLESNPPDAMILDIIGDKLESISEAAYELTSFAMRQSD